MGRATRRALEVMRRPFSSSARLGWLVATSVYFGAVFQRSSLGVAGLQAERRFHITPAQLSTFVLLQLGVYAAMQIPTGVLVDRFGPRRMLTAAAVIMAVAQLGFAFAPDYPAALLARGLLGCGDAMTFVSVLRFTSVRAGPRLYPVLVAVTGVVGSAGNVLATLPLSLVLRSAGWTPTFAVAAAASALTATLVWALLPETASSGRGRRSLSELRAVGRRVGHQVMLARSTPGTRLGFWVHFSTMPTTTVFGVLWGVPYLVSLGCSQSLASTVLLATVVLGVVSGPGLGVLISRHPATRVPTSLAICVLTVLGWALVLGPGGEHPPLALVAVVAVFSALGGPASSFGFAIARDYNQPATVGTASGVVNVGGFVASITGAALVGVVLDARGTSSAASFRLAFAALLCVQVVGTAQVAKWWLRLRRIALHAQRRGETVPVPILEHWWDQIGMR